MPVPTETGQEVTTTMTTATGQLVAELTVGQLRCLLEPLPADTPLQLGIRDEQHFNSFLGSVPIAGASVQPYPGGHAVVFEVPRTARS